MTANNEKEYSQVAIVTLNWNQSSYSIFCIESLLKSNYGSLTIILVDNNSEFQDFKKIKEYIDTLNDQRIILIRNEKNLGYVGGINVGLQKAQELLSDYILIMNNDTIIDKNAVSELMSCCKRNNNKVITSGIVYWYDTPEIIQNTGKIFTSWNKNPAPIGMNDKDTGQFKTDVERDMLDDIFWLFPSRLLDEIGFYSTYFWFNYEQADFAMRAKSKGYRLIFTPGAKLWHKSGVSIGGREKNPIKSYYTFQGKLIYIFSHFSFAIFIFNYFKLIASIIAEFARVLAGKTNLKNALAKLLGFFYFHKWLVFRNANDGSIPEFLKK